MAENQISSPVDLETIETNSKRVSEFRRFLRVFLGRKIVLVGLVIILILVVVAIFAPLIAPYDYTVSDMQHILSGPSAQHWLGTDTIGRDTLSRLIWGSRNSLIVSIVALLVAAGIGMSLGLIAGYVGGATYSVIMRFIDALMTFPMMLLALTIAAVLGGGMLNVIIALGVALIPAYARLMCGQAIMVKNNDYILAAETVGVSRWNIMWKHVAPNCFPPLIVMMTMQLGGTILAEAGLSFLGIGIKPPGAAWGAMVNEGYRYLLSDPILSIAPGVAIMLVVFAFNMVGDGLRDALDPRLRGLL